MNILQRIFNREEQQEQQEQQEQEESPVSNEQEDESFPYMEPLCDI
jgi:hypothetical protein